MNLMKCYYLIKPLIPRSIQIMMRQHYVARLKNNYSDRWPVDPKSSTIPTEWKGWPGNKKFTVILTHDVEKQKGVRRCEQLLTIEKELGFKSSFNFVPERYRVPMELRYTIEDNGFEVGVHGLNHDGKLFESKPTFENRVKRINQYIEAWNAVGFRAPAMHHNLEWQHALNIQYDLSTFDTDPFEPQSDGVGTIFPFWVKDDNTGHQYLEMPYTLVQDFTLFILMKEKGPDIWKQKVDWIAQNGGMVLVNVHPDYLYFNEGKRQIEEYPVDFYVDFLNYIKDNYQGQYWHGLPKELAEYLRNQ